jgi:hypothetical protein
MDQIRQKGKRMEKGEDERINKRSIMIKIFVLPDSVID